MDAIDIIALAKEADMLPIKKISRDMEIEWWSVTSKSLETFAELIAQRAIAEALISVSFEVAQEREKMEWKRIETAPMDGTPIIALMNWPQFKTKNVGVVRFGCDAFGDYRFLGNDSVPPKTGVGSPTHWIPLNEAL